MKKYILGMIVGLLSHNVVAGDSHYHNATAKLFDQKGNSIGKVAFYQHKNGVQVEARVTGLAAGFHGFHIHAKGECLVEAPPAVPFASAGPHFEQVVDSNHRDHNGDFPVLLVNKDGTAKTEFKTDRFKIRDLFDGDGSAVIIHANPDNYANIPAGYAPASADVTKATLATGDAGGRSVCGVVKRW